MEIEQRTLNGLDKQVSLFHPILEGGNAAYDAGAPRKHRPTLSHREQRHYQKGDQCKSKQTRVQAQSMGKRYERQSRQNPRDSGHYPRYDIEAAIESHRGETTGNGYFCTHARHSDRISKRLPQDPELSGGFRSQSKPHQTRNGDLMLVVTECKPPAPGPRKVRESGQGNYKDDSPTEFGEAFPKPAVTSSPDKVKKKACA